MDSTKPLHRVLFLPWDLSTSVEEIGVSDLENDLAAQIDEHNVINVIRILLIRPTHTEQGLYAHFLPQAKSPNERATRLAMACGLFGHRFRGNVIVSRLGTDSFEESGLVVACCVTPDLRQCILEDLVAKPQAIARWLGNACRDNYHDAPVLNRLSEVMKVNSTDDDNGEITLIQVDTPSTENYLNSCDLDALPLNEFVTAVPLCLYCRAPASTICRGCSGAYFCDEPSLCRENGWTHDCLCATWKIYVERRKMLSSFPLPWCDELVGSAFQCSDQPYEVFLRQQSILSDDEASSSWWRTETGGWSGGESDSAKTVDVSIRRSYKDGFHPVSHLPHERNVSEDDIARAGLTDRNTVGMLRVFSWKDYYILRGIPLESPVALLLSFPATLYFSLVTYGEVPCTVAKMLNRPIRIHIVGAEKEVNFLDLFKEVAYLVPDDVDLEIVFVVRQDMLPPTMRSLNRFKVNLAINLDIFVVSGIYGGSLDPNFDCGTGPPDFIMAFNAGLFAYESWRTVVAYLDQHSGVVGVFTDYNEHSGVQCASLGGQESRESVRVNPFRQPRAMPVYSMALPQFSNAFLYVYNAAELEQ